MTSRLNFQTTFKPVSNGAKTKYIVTTPHGEITRTSDRQYAAIAYCVREDKIAGVSFAGSVDLAAKAATQWKTGNVYYGALVA